MYTILSIIETLRKGITPSQQTIEKKDTSKEIAMPRLHKAVRDSRKVDVKAFVNAGEDVNER